jgi:hypothetical protein
MAERPRPDRRARESQVRTADGEQPNYAAFEARPALYPETSSTPWSLRAAWATFLLALLGFGVVAGYHIAGGRLFRIGGLLQRPDSYALRLTPIPSGDGILLRWNTDAPAIQAAWRGVLTITEGNDNRTIQLDLPQLRNGTVLYRHTAPALRFRLDVYLSERRMISEIAEWGPGSVNSAPAEIRPSTPEPR